MQKYTFSFDESKKLTNLELGGKGASLVKMKTLGLPVPPGFIICTEAGKKFSTNDFQIPEYFRVEVKEQLSALEKKIQKIVNKSISFGDSNYPLLLSVRSGAPISMPGQMSTILNVGMTSNSIDNLIFPKGLSLDLYWKLLRSFYIAMGGEIRDLLRLEEGYDLTHGIQKLYSIAPQKAIEFIESYKRNIEDKYGNDFFIKLNRPEEQLWMAINTVWLSWILPSNIQYRQLQGISNNTWTAVVVQMMVLGNKGENSGAGVVYSRDLRTGKEEDPMAGSFLVNEQGEAVVGGESKAKDNLEDLMTGNMSIYRQLRKYVNIIENEYRSPLDIEFTVEDNKLWLLQARTAPLSDQAMIEFVVEKVRGKNNKSLLSVKKNWFLTERDAVERIHPSLMERLSLPVFSPQEKSNSFQKGLLLAKGNPASAGVAVGRIAVSEKQALQFAIEQIPFILVKDSLNPKQTLAMKNCSGIISLKSSVGSHGAIIANERRKPCIVCCEGIDEVNECERYIVVLGKRYYEDEENIISVDAFSGEVFWGAISKVDPIPFPAQMVFQGWWDKYNGSNENKGTITSGDGRPHSSWGNATDPLNYTIVDEFRTQIREHLARRYWNTEKARVVEALHIIPDEMRIKQVVIEANNKKAIEEAMYDVIKEKDVNGSPVYWNGPRTALGPGTVGSAPWQMGMDKEEQILEFLTQRDFKGVEKAKSGGYPRWMTPDSSDPWQSAPAQIIVMYDPAEKGVEKFEPDHFVCNISCRSNPDQILVDLNLGTAQLRSFEDIKPEKLVRINMELNPLNPNYIGKKEIIFGKCYWNLSTINQYKDFKQYNENRLENIISEMMIHNELSDDLLIHLVGKKNFRIVKGIEETIFGDWWTKYLLPYRMRALDEVYSLQVLEIQGRVDNIGNIIWMLVYDAKGRDEKAIVMND